MNRSSPTGKPRFVVATPGRSVCDQNARVLDRVGWLRLYLLGTRRGTPGISPERTRLKPAIGLLAYAAARTCSTYRAESFRFRLHPWFDGWVRRQLLPGDHILSSYGYANESFRWVRKNGGRTFLDAGNSHPENFWEILSEEHRRWNWSGPPIARHQQERALAMMPDVDYVLSPSSYVTKSFLARGFRPEQVLRNVYPVDLTCFKPAPSPRDPRRPLTVISTGSLSLRKGTPYLLEGFRLLLQRHPSARLWLTRSIHDSARPVLAKYRDLPIEWAPSLPHPRLAERLQGADVYVLPSLEEGLARTALEAMACGLPVVVTNHTGANDFVQSGVNGEIVPIRDPQAIADAILKCADRIRSGANVSPVQMDVQPFSNERFEADFLAQLQSLALT